MTTEEQTMCEEHKAAICLNNTGATLLHRHCYRQAFCTLSDALVAMNALGASQVSEAAATNQPTACFGIKEKLDQAAGRLANPDSTTIHHVKRPCNLQVLCDDHSPALLRSYLSPETSSSTPIFAYLLRIENFSLQLPGKSEMELHSSIILYNFGIAYRCLAASGVLNDNMPRMVALQVTAMRIMHLAYSILCKNCDQGRDTNDAELFERSVLIAMLVLQNLMQLSSELGRTEDCQEYAQRLNTLQTYLSRMHDCLPASMAAGAA